MQSLFSAAPVDLTRTTTPRPARRLAAELSDCGVPMLLIRGNVAAVTHSTTLGLLDTDRLNRIRRAEEPRSRGAGEQLLTATRCGTSAQPADVANAGRLDLGGVDRGPLGTIGGFGEVGREVRSEGAQLTIEAFVQPADDLLAEMQTLVLGPQLQVVVPGLTRCGPLVSMAMQPAELSCR